VNGTIPPSVDVVNAREVFEREMPERVKQAMGELVLSARDGLMALSATVGVGVLSALMEEELTGLVGVKGKHNPDRAATRHGYENGEVTMGSRKVGVKRPRARTKDNQEVSLSVYEHFQREDQLCDLVLERMIAGISTRRFAGTQEYLGEEIERISKSTSKSTISRKFIERSMWALQVLMSRGLEDIRLAVLMIDGVVLRGQTNVVALGVTTQGEKIPLGLWQGSTENATVATSLLADLVDRGLDVTQGVLCVLDGSKALRKAVRDVLGERTPVQRCVRHYANLLFMPMCSGGLAG
jgi:putative transposase